MQFVEVDSIDPGVPETEDLTRDSANPFQFASAGAAPEAKTDLRSPSHIEEYTDQWLKAAEVPDEDIEDSQNSSSELSVKTPLTDTPEAKIRFQDEENSVFEAETDEKTAEKPFSGVEKEGEEEEVVADTPYVTRSGVYMASLDLKTPDPMEEQIPPVFDPSVTAPSRANEPSIPPRSLINSGNYQTGRISPPSENVFELEPGLGKEERKVEDTLEHGQLEGKPDVPYFTRSSAYLTSTVPVLDSHSIDAPGRISPSSKVQIRAETEVVDAGPEDKGEEEGVSAEAPYMTRSAIYRSGLDVHRTGEMPIPHIDKRSSDQIRPSTNPENLLSRDYEISMFSRSDESSGNFQTGRLSPPPDDLETSPVTVLPTVPLPETQFRDIEIAQIWGSQHTYEGSSGSSSEGEGGKADAGILEEEEKMEEEMRKTGETAEDVVTRISLKLNIPVKTQSKSAQEKEIKARISIRPSVRQNVPIALRAPSFILDEEMRGIRDFLMRPLHPELRLQCSIIRNRSGFKRFFPVYSLRIEQSSTFLLSAKKRPNNKTSNYLLSMNESDLKKSSKSYMGKLRSNFLGTEYNIFDSGVNPKRKKATPSNIREQLGVIFYVRFRQETKAKIAPKKMTVLLPMVTQDRVRTAWKPKGVTYR